MYNKYDMINHFIRNIISTGHATSLKIFFFFCFLGAE